MSNRVIGFEHDGFPCESNPPQGHVTLMLQDGTKETFFTFITKFEKFKEQFHKDPLTPKEKLINILKKF